MRVVCVALLIGCASAFQHPRSFIPRVLRTRTAIKAVAEGGAGRALIVQNKGGGHGELGYHLALQLAEEKSLAVTLLHDGGPSPKAGKQPWDSYGTLEAAGVEILWADLSSTTTADALEGKAPYEFVFDNWSKDVEMATPTVTLAKAWDSANYVFVSSAGMYTGKGELKEGDEVKETGQRAVEMLLEAEGLPWTSFRPQYIYGDYTNKRDYLDFFFDRSVRKLPIPCPEAGKQGVCCTNAEDVASLLLAPLGKPEAVGQVFNCGTDDIVTYEALCGMVADCTGGSAEISYVDKDKAKEVKFPFRPNPEGFYVNVDKAKSVLGWAPKHTLAADLKVYGEKYLELGLDKKEFAGDGL